MATIQKRDRKDGPVYRAMVRIKGFPDQHRTFRRLSDAKSWAQKTEIAIRDGDFKNVVKTASSKTLTNVIERYRTEGRRWWQQRNAHHGQWRRNADKN